MEFYPSPSSVPITTNPGVVMQGGCGVQNCGTCAPKKNERVNVISCETIAIHTITNIILWSFAALVIGSTPNVSYSSKVGVNQDGQNQGKQEEKKHTHFCFDPLTIFLSLIVFTNFFIRCWFYAHLVVHSSCSLWRNLSYSRT